MKTSNLNNNLNIPGNSIKRIIKNSLKIFTVLIVFVILVGGTGGVLVAVGYIQEAPAFDSAELKPPQTSFVYDREGELVTSFSGEQYRVSTDLEEMPEYVPESFIAIEDERFYGHFGVDTTGIVRAIWVNMRNRGIVQGASTITQQLVRNAFLSPEQSMKRKIQESYMAIKMEEKYEKEEILELYLNRIYFGNGAYGVEAAAQTYYDKSASELTLPEAAELAGIPSAPNYNNPWSSQERARSGRNQVLNRMESLGFISSAEATVARRKELVYAEPSVEYDYPYFIDHVLHRELKDILVSLPQYDNAQEAYNAVYTGGLRVHTTMDTELQAHVEDLLNRDELYPETIYIDMDKLREAMGNNNNRVPADYPEAYINEEKGVPQPQAAMVMAEPDSGEVMALGGGRNYDHNGNQLLRFRSRRQPGSAIKPITSYVPAFEVKALSPGSVVADTPYESADERYQPRNWDGRFLGDMTAREALVLSRNIPAVKTLEKIGPSTGAEYAKSMGINTILEEEKGNLSLALGGLTAGVTALDMTQAYGVLANEGAKVPMHTVTRIEDRQGYLIWEKQTSPRRVLSSQTAYMINDTLEESHRRFIGNRLYVDRPVAAKTGTTNDNRDAYLVSYTPNLVTTFWMGYDIQEMGQIHQGHSYSTSFTREALEKAFEKLPEEEFQRPSGLSEVSICSVSGLRPSHHCRDAGTVTTGMFTSDMVPQAVCRIHEKDESEEEDESEESTEDPEDPENGEDNGDVEEDVGDNGEEEDEEDSEEPEEPEEDPENGEDNGEEEDAEDNVEEEFEGEVEEEGQEENGEEEDREEIEDSGEERENDSSREDED